jgi:phage terminase large subunit-like protein
VFQKTEKQKELYRLFKKNRTVLAEGGGRSGKTTAIVRYIILRALKFPGTDHLIGRFRFSHCKQSICFQTFPKLAEIEGLNYNSFLNKSDWFYDFPNGSKIWIGGFDSKERTEKILGNEFSTIYLNESSQIDFNTYEMILSRLNPSQGVPGKMLIDLNPSSINHWVYRLFHSRKFPDGRPVPEDDFKFIKINPADNPHVSPDYISTLQTMSAAKRLRFLEGEYSTDSGSLWKRDWISYGQADRYERIVIGVDPSGTVGGDEVGIIVCAKSGNEFFVLDDRSLHGTPAQWAAEVAAAYNEHRADLVIAEKNYGGDMVLHTLQTAQRNINVRLVTSSRGKLIRAEPISALYEHGRVKHRIPFYDLENEYCTYDGKEVTASPNRLDAAVFALTELAGSSGGSVVAVKTWGV